VLSGFPPAPALTPRQAFEAAYGRARAAEALFGGAEAARSSSDDDVDVDAPIFAPGSAAAQYLGASSPAPVLLGGVALPRFGRPTAAAGARPPSPAPSGNSLLAPIRSASASPARARAEAAAAEPGGASTALILSPQPRMLHGGAGAGAGGARAAAHLPPDAHALAVPSLIDTAIDEAIRTPMHVLLRRASGAASDGGEGTSSPSSSSSAFPFPLSVPASVSKRPFASALSPAGVAASALPSSAPPAAVTIEEVLRAKRLAEGMATRFRRARLLASAGGEEAATTATAAAAGPLSPSPSPTPAGPEVADAALAAYSAYADSLVAMLRAQTAAAETFKRAELDTARRDWSIMRNVAKAAADKVGDLTAARDDAERGRAEGDAELRERHAALEAEFASLLQVSEGLDRDLEEARGSRAAFEADAAEARKEAELARAQKEEYRILLEEATATMQGLSAGAAQAAAAAAVAAAAAPSAPSAEAGVNTSASLAAGVGESGENEAARLTARVATMEAAHARADATALAERLGRAEAGREAAEGDVLDASAAVEQLTKENSAMRVRMAELLLSVMERDDIIADLEQAKATAASSGAAAAAAAAATSAASSSFTSSSTSAASPSTKDAVEAVALLSELARIVIPSAAHSPASIGGGLNSLATSPATPAGAATLDSATRAGDIAASLHARILELSRERDALRLSCDKLSEETRELRDRAGAPGRAALLASAIGGGGGGGSGPSALSTSAFASTPLKESGVGAFGARSHVGGGGLFSAHGLFSPSALATPAPAHGGAGGFGGSMAAPPTAARAARDAALQSLAADNRRLSEQLLSLQAIADSQGREVTRGAAALATARAAAADAERRAEGAAADRDRILRAHESLQAAHAACGATSGGAAAASASALASAQAELARAESDVARLQAYADSLEAAVAQALAGREAVGGGSSAPSPSAMISAAAAAAPLPRRPVLGRDAEMNTSSGPGMGKVASLIAALPLHASSGGSATAAGPSSARPLSASVLRFAAPVHAVPSALLSPSAPAASDMLPQGGGAGGAVEAADAPADAAAAALAPPLSFPALRMPTTASADGAALAALSAARSVSRGRVLRRMVVRTTGDIELEYGSPGRGGGGAGEGCGDAGSVADGDGDGDDAASTTSSSFAAGAAALPKTVSVSVSAAGKASLASMHPSAVKAQLESLAASLRAGQAATSKGGRGSRRAGGGRSGGGHGERAHGRVGPHRAVSAPREGAAAAPVAWEVPAAVAAPAAPSFFAQQQRVHTAPSPAEGAGGEVARLSSLLAATDAEIALGLASGGQPDEALLCARNIVEQALAKHAVAVASASAAAAVVGGGDAQGRRRQGHPAPPRSASVAPALSYAAPPQAPVAAAFAAPAAVSAPPRASAAPSGPRALSAPPVRTSTGAAEGGSLFPRWPGGTLQASALPSLASAGPAAAAAVAAAAPVSFSSSAPSGAASSSSSVLPSRNPIPTPATVLRLSSVPAEHLPAPVQQQHCGKPPRPRGAASSREGSGPAVGEGVGFEGRRQQQQQQQQFFARPVAAVATTDEFAGMEWEELRRG
jgi:hypothetical protein